ncbi:MAG: hypothetical protein DCC68_05520 [Planctomycetota bacterium]|nr:MAG: hypothetical protein DCC68_05520 [Planctomycetota bacterium]
MREEMDDPVGTAHPTRLVRIYDDPPIGNITTTSTDFVDFRTLSGHIVRVPGQLFDFPGATVSAFQDYGWWVLVENPNQ